MKWWPFGKAEERSAGYTTLATSRLEDDLVGAGDAGVIATAALEAAAGLYARSMAAAVVKGPPAIVRALTPTVLAHVARELIRVGQSHYRIIVAGGEVRLFPLAHAYAYGSDPDPLRWWYHGSVYGPTGSEHHWLPARSVLHTKYAFDTARPWIGIPPHWCSDSEVIDQETRG